MITARLEGIGWDFTIVPVPTPVVPTELCGSLVGVSLTAALAISQSLLERRQRLSPVAGLAASGQSLLDR
jgi:hypothetical protein